jgi:GNAT superfamily N-acetyltransferase
VTDPPFKIRRYCAADLARVLEVTAEGFVTASVERRIDLEYPDLRPPMDWSAAKCEDVADDLRRHPDGCFVAEVGGEVVGYVTTAVHEGRLQGRIPNLATDRRFRNLGIGRALLERAIADFRERGLKVARIETLADNAVGNHLYPSLGFREIVRQVHFVLELD